MALESINPYTGTIIKRYSYHTDEEVEVAIHQAQSAYIKHKSSSHADRGTMLHRAADLLQTRKVPYATMMTQEMGKPLSEALGEIEKCAWVCRYYADHGATFLADEAIETSASHSMITYQPLGVILAVMPWNFPFWQVMRWAAPTLMAGNTCLLKHASNVSGSALLIQEVLRDAGFTDGRFTTLLISADRVGPLLADRRIKAATLTGSGPAGSAVAAIAGKHLKATVLELGGNDPYLILADADLAHAAAQCVESRMLNTGQSCIGAKRFIAVDAIYDDFVRLVVDRMQKIKAGDPMQAVDIGPMARHDLRDEVHEQVMQSVDAGARITLGGKIPQGPGANYPPTLLEQVCPSMPAYEDEIFGPVASVIRADNTYDAIRIANDSAYGLGACVFTRDIERGRQIATHELEAGSCFVNQYVKSDPRLPFGGIKDSGYGRELGRDGIRAFCNIKTVYIR